MRLKLQVVYGWTNILVGNQTISPETPCDTKIDEDVYKHSEAGDGILPRQIHEAVLPSLHLLDLTRRDSCQFGKDRVENELLHPRPSVDEDLLDLVPYGLVEIGRCVSRLPSDLPSLISTGPRVGPEVARLIRQWGVRIDYQSLVFVSKS